MTIGPGATAFVLRRPLPLPDKVECYAIAAVAAKKARVLSGWLGDGLVPVDSALGRHKDPQRTLAFPKSRQWVGYGMSHFDLLNEPAVYERLKQWLA